MPDKSCSGSLSGSTKILLAIRIGRAVMKHDGTATFMRFRIPELAALALPDGIPGNHHVAAPRESLAQCLVMKFSVRRVTGGHQNRRMLALVVLRDVNQRGDVNAWQTLEHQFFDDE